MDQAKNFAKATVDPNGNYDSTSTSIDLVAGHGVRLPDTECQLVWWNITDYPDPADAYHAGDAEIVGLTSKSTDTLTILRAQQGTDAIDHNTAGKTYAIAQTWTAADANTLTPIEYNGADMAIDTGAGGFSAGDLNSLGNSTIFAINDSQNTIYLVGNVNAGIPSSDPHVEGSLYYNAVTGVVSRSAG